MVPVIFFNSIPPGNEVLGRYCFHRCLSVWGGVMHHGISQMVEYLPLPAPWTWELGTYPTPPLLLTSGWNHWRPVQFKLVHLRTYPPPVLTPCGGQRNPYSWKVGSTHPTGMLSCLMMMSPIFNIVNKLKKHGIKNNLSNRICVELDYQRIQTKRYPFHDHRYTVFH